MSEAKTARSSGETLRARKQRQTREAIHRAALRRALEYGIDNVTVAEVSAEANVSPRTFFNYFPTKEDAILGLRDVQDSVAEDAAMESLMDREPTGDLLADVTNLVRSVFSATLSGNTRDQIREAVIRYPQLRRRQLERFSLVEQRLGRIVARHLESDSGSATPRHRRRGPHDRRDLRWRHPLRHPQVRDHHAASSRKPNTTSTRRWNY